MFSQMETELIHGVAVEAENLVALKAMTTHPLIKEQVALVYLDPPFATGRDFGAFDDRWLGGRRELVDFLTPRLELIREVLAPNGSVLVHIDPRISPQVAMALDEIFGPGDRDRTKDSTQPGFRNELIWVYGLGGSSRTRYPRKHDTIFWYTKGSEWHFSPPMIPATSAKMRGKLKKQPDVFSVEASGDLLDIPSINNMSNERVGYPTQKPLALLEQLILAHSREGDLVVDPFCGSGTTLVAAVKNKRRALGVDQGKEAVVVANKRLRELGKEPQK
jgi:DNA modification methylase